MPPVPAAVPREVIALMVDILFDTADDALTKPGTVRTIYDRATIPSASKPTVTVRVGLAYVSDPVEMFRVRFVK